MPPYLKKIKIKGKEAIRPEETKKGKGRMVFLRKLLIYENLTVQFQI
jgi:hypothetical protein